VPQAVLAGQLTSYKGVVTVTSVLPSGVKWPLSTNGAVLLYISEEFMQYEKDVNLLMF